jgi:hypothetical protein
LAALDGALMTQKVSYVLDVDIRTFFDPVDHGWLLRMIAHRIADRRVLRLIERWLNPRERPMGTGGSGDTAGVGGQPSYNLAKTAFEDRPGWDGRIMERRGKRC